MNRLFCRFPIRVRESIFENRFKYLDELRKMGGTVTVESNIAIIEGVEKYEGASVTAPDLRAGAAMGPLWRNFDY